MQRAKETTIFLLCSLLTCLAVFQDALWGESIAAPIDIAPALWKHYHHVDPNQGPIPKNHYTVDQLSYDLPLQYLMHQAWRSGEIPWWNPYSAGGRPLLADAHCNGTDPIRLLVYFTVSDFVLAYNWTLILHAIGTGVGVFLLLRAFGARPWVAGACALAAQWAGGYVLYVGHPWVRASFLYYPLLWMAWDRAWTARKRPSWVASLLVAAIFYSGNLQSHLYLPIFAACLTAGYAGRNWERWSRVVKLIAPAFLLGAMLAAPVLLPQIELYLHSVRPMGENPRLHWLESAAVLCGIHPWASGTFRTLSIPSVSGGPSFHLAIGGAFVILAVFGWARRSQSLTDRAVLTTAGFLVLAFLLIAWTPLNPILYLRTAGLGILGLTVLAASGTESLLRCERVDRGWSRGVWIATALIVLGTGLLAHAIYPRFRAQAETMLLARADMDGYGGASRALRKFQAANFTAEVSPLNVECALNLIALALLGFAFVRCQRRILATACVLSLVPLLSFAARFITKSPVATWARLLGEGPLQQRIMARIGANERFIDTAPQDYLRIFPQEISGLQRLHVAHGYAALLPPAAGSLNFRGPALRSNDSEMRFSWKNGSPETPTVITESLTSLRVGLDRPSDAVLVRRDTFYPGWRVDGEPLLPVEPGKVAGVLVLKGQRELHFVYQPAGMRWALASLLIGMAILGGLAWTSRLRRRRR
jgi:hypothetical protein